MLNPAQLIDRVAIVRANKKSSDDGTPEYSEQTVWAGVGRFEITDVGQRKTKENPAGAAGTRVTNGHLVLPLDADLRHLDHIEVTPHGSDETLRFRLDGFGSASGMHLASHQEAWLIRAELD